MNINKKETYLMAALLVLFCINFALAVWFSATGSKNGKAGASEILAGEAIGLVHIYGPITTSQSSPLFDPDGSDGIINQLNEFKKDKRVKALIIRINSPGGTVGASQEIFAKIKDLKTHRKIPIIVSIADMGASGAFWVAMAGDTVFANPGSLVGNIGVIMTHPDLTEFAEKYGIDMVTHKSGPYKDLGSMWRKENDGDKAILSGIMTNIHDQFVKTVQEARGLSDEESAQLSDGRIYTGEQAQLVGLIDRLGSMQDVIQFAKQEAKIKGEPEIITKSGYPFQQIWSEWFSRFQSYLPFSSSSWSLPKVQ